MMLAWLSSSEKTTSAAAGQRGDRSEVGQVARTEQERCLVSREGGEPLLQPTVQGHVSRDQAGGAGAGAEPLRGVGRRLADAWMVREAQVVVGAEQQDLGAVQRHPRPLRALDQPQAAIQPRLPQLIEPLGDVAH